MSSFLDEIIKSNSSYETKTDVHSAFNHDSLETRIKHEFNSIDLATLNDHEKVLNSNIDGWMSFLRNNIMEEFNGIKLIIRDISKNIIIDEVKRFENEMLQLKICNIENQNLINKLNKDLQSYKGNIKNLSNKLTKNKNKLIEAKYMFNWRLRKEQVDRQRFCEKIADKFYHINTMKKAFYKWKGSLEMTWKNRNNSKIERQAQSVCNQLVSEYEQQIIELRTEISKLQEENASIQTSRSATEDAVKKALMRGVCALNMETMSILNQNGILTDNTRERNNNCFPNLSEFAIKTKTSTLVSENLEYLEDQPRFPLKTWNVLDCKDNFSYSNPEANSTNVNNSTDNFEVKKSFNSSNISSVGNLQYSNSGHTNLKTIKTKPSLPNEFISSKQSVIKNSTMTVQAGNPTGSHTQSLNSSLNITVQRHNNDTVLQAYSCNNHQLNVVERKFLKQ